MTTESGFNQIHWLPSYPKDYTKKAIPDKFCFPFLLCDNETKLIKGVRLRWKLRLTSTNGEQLLSYITEEDFRVFQKPSIEIIRQTITNSYDRFCENFYINALSDGISYELAPLNEGDYNTISTAVLALLP
jgi:hypothetical protein